MTTGSRGTESGNSTLPPNCISALVNGQRALLNVYTPRHAGRHIVLTTASQQRLHTVGSPIQPLSSLFIAMETYNTNVIQLRRVNMELLESFIGLTYNQDDRILFIWPGTMRCMLKV